ncbi:hypothetical protein DPMN_184237 [Dreissena polymorpha]|uniref:C1q domain-containing protein n=1 Tax=Dreissena polymorpha TaxID=45954 RepID=A0A9D4I7P5_DREPO|nr:hypothetical protein DPMN_184237 [Dreissena polymorpha]
MAESRLEWDDHQGSNTEVVRFDVGDEVWISYEHDSNHPVFGDDNARMTSFTGVLLQASFP